MCVGPIYARSLRLLSDTLPQFGADQAQTGQGVIHYEADYTLGKDFAICALDLVTLPLVYIHTYIQTYIHTYNT